MSYIVSGTKTYRKASLALFAAGFVTFSNLYTTQPLLPIFAHDYHIRPATASLTISVSTAALAIVMIIAASVSDAIGRKRIMTFSMFFGSLTALLTAFSPSFFMLILLRTLLGAVFAGVPAIAMAYVGEEFEKQSLGRVMGQYISGNSIGGLFGRLSTGVLTDWFNWHIALFAIGVLSLLLSVYFHFALPKSAHFTPKPTSFSLSVKKLVGHLKHRHLVSLFCLAFLIMGSFVTMFNYIAFQLTKEPYNVSQTVIGFIFLVYLTGTFSSTFMGKKADQIGKARAVKQSLGIMMAGAIITLIPHLIIKIIGLSVFTFGFFGAHAVASSWVGDRARVHKAQASSLYLLFYYIGSSVIGVCGGFFFSLGGWFGVILLILALTMMAFALTFVSEKQKETPAF
ncbi:MFS transporter [Tuberibacillus calidus]|jgi:YNFM family putative membrane transporter|uniref:MFS transporter n=1 Tax=Tuberibacillus calidus TaxID=340097 RepID=UPI000413A17F|nr:MFS transporter [Tuberibacillus calidus]